MQITRIVDCKTILGEGPLWDVLEQKIYWLDSFGGRIFRADENGHGIESWSVPAAIGSMALRMSGGAVLSLADGFYLFDFETGITTPVQSVPHKTRNVRLNDGKVDRRGRFLAGSMDTSEKAPLGVIYSVADDHSVSEVAEDFTVVNGPCWSPDQSRFYVSDSFAHTIWVFDYDLASGSISNRRVFCTFGLEDGWPDGATVDADGFVWSAGVFSGKIHRFDPSGKRALTIDLPVVCGTSVMFGGPNLDRLYFTSMLQPTLPGVVETGLQAGSLFVIDGLGVKGLPETRYAG
jgi:L-arabinonolactonase